MGERCPRDNIPISVMEEYWAGHLATGSVGDWSLHPIMSYSDALRLAREDVLDMGIENVPVVVPREPLNQTSFVAEEDFIPSYNGQKSFEEAEWGHGANSLAISITSVGVPILFSLGRFLPGRSHLTSRIKVFLDQPFWGRHYRTPMTSNIGIVPTRGQTLFIAYIMLVNIFLVVFPYSLLQPNFMHVSDHAQLTQIVGDRAGVLAFANFVALFLFSSRNNLLLWITDWSHSTYLLLHRWVAYACIGQTVLHSILMLYYYDRWHDDIAESKLPYWYWGIIATLAMCIMLPLALLPIRQRVYQVFLSLHQVLAALTLIGSFLHIWYLFEYKWGYEIWIYIAGGIWFLDRAWRIARVVRNGIRSATISSIDASGEYLRLDIEGLVADGHVYVYFPTLGWRFWENHPFSVLAHFTGRSSRTRLVKDGSESDPEKSSKDAAAGIATEGADSAETFHSQPSHGAANGPNTIGPRSTLVIRTREGTTRDLASRVLASGGSLQLPILIESSYHSNPSSRNLTHCSTLLCIAGGVGITGIMTHVRQFSGPRARVCWSVRSNALARAIQPEIQQLLDSNVEVETTVGSRLPLERIIREELGRQDEKGHVGVVVCGPAGMADEVRRLVGEMASGSHRGIIFVDEAFSW
ncbi:hypothetical protein VTO42DRAFT_3565 [Malbranchea cinnamomea]